MESKKNPSLQRFLISAPPPYASAEVLERFLEEAKKWPKKTLADAHVQRVLADTRRNLEWAKKNPVRDAEKSDTGIIENEKRLKDSGLFQSKRQTK